MPYALYCRIVPHPLTRHVQENHAAPARIIVYRDGVSEGQFGEVSK